MDTAWVHNLSPFLLQFTDTIGIRWYGLAYLTGFLIAYYLTDLMSRRGTTPLNREQVSDFITYVAIGTLAGGRLGYALFYAPELFTTFHAGAPWWGLLEVNKGGMASHGGMAGVIIACVLFARKHKFNATHLIDICVFGGGFGVFFGRIANFINGELYGRECSANLWMAVKFPSEIFTWGPGEIDKLRGLGAAAEAVGAGSKEQWLIWLNSFSSEALRHLDETKEAIVLATQKHNVAVIEALRPLLTPRYPSQLIQSVLEGLIVVLVLAWVWRRSRTPGLISATFGVMYSIARIIGEQFRLPDHDIGYQALGLTRGQWLSVAMLAGSLIYLIWVIRQKNQPMGGWSKK
jgi:phosphatidylglycerol:prolipoprotein diacylglycerol transferase